jgi:hypothetical protein
MARLTMLHPAASAPPHPEAGAPGVFTWVHEDGTTWGHGFRVGTERWLALPNVGRFRLGAHGADADVVPDSGVLEHVIRDAYRRCVLPMALHANGAEVLHASGVVVDGGVVALCAGARTGKSTLAYTLTQRGHIAWADDAVAFHFDGTRPYSTPQPFELRLRSSAAEFFGRNGGAAAAGDGSQGLRPFKAAVVLERADEVDVELERLSAAAAFTRLLEHAYSYDLSDPERKRRMMETYTQLVASVPVWRLRFRAGWERVSRVADAIEATRGAA